MNPPSPSQPSPDTAGPAGDLASASAPRPARISAGIARTPLGADSPHRKTIKSFVLRAGRTTTGQARAFEELGPTYVLPYRASPLVMATTFGRVAPVALEIGFGMGEATASIAEQMPDHDFLCCEVHEPGVGALLKRIGERRLTNIRILRHDAVEVLEHMIAPDTLARVHLFFPDPWHKKRHHKRRIVQPFFIHRVASRLAQGGTFHCATDWEPYAVQMRELLEAEPLLINRSDGYAPRPAYRPLTKFENRGLRLGHGVFDLLLERR